MLTFLIILGIFNVFFNSYVHYCKKCYKIIFSGRRGSCWKSLVNRLMTSSWTLRLVWFLESMGNQSQWGIELIIIRLICSFFLKICSTADFIKQSKLIFRLPYHYVRFLVSTSYFSIFAKYCSEFYYCLGGTPLPKRSDTRSNQLQHSRKRRAENQIYENVQLVQIPKSNPIALNNLEGYICDNLEGGIVEEFEVRKTNTATTISML